MFWHFKTQRWLDDKKSWSKCRSCSYTTSCNTKCSTEQCTNEQSGKQFRESRKGFGYDQCQSPINLAMQGLLNAFKEN
jgi:radical SAM protein with 4Fe4S-binding SPASM domain